MADMTGSKKEFADQMQAVVRQALKLVAQMDELNASFSVHKFDANDTNAFVDGDFLTSNTHLTAAIVADVMFALGTVSNAATVGVRNSLRECLIGGLP